MPLGLPAEIVDLLADQRLDRVDLGRGRRARHAAAVVDGHGHVIPPAIVVGRGRVNGCRGWRTSPSFQQLRLSPRTAKGLAMLTFCTTVAAVAASVGKLKFFQTVRKRAMLHWALA